MTSSKSKQSKSSSASTVKSSLPAELEELRTRVFVERASVQHNNAYVTPDAFSAYGNPNYLTLQSFTQEVSIDIICVGSDSVVFDLIGVETPIANALRRILLAEVPTMAIEKVIIFQNTSIVQDEVLAHRLGLLPIQADPDAFDYLNPSMGGDGIMNENNTTVMVLDVKCCRNAHVADTAPPAELYNNHLIQSSQLQWIPQGQQSERFKHNPIKPCYDDIVIAKLRPGQSIEAELYIEKGIGQQHAKWSPVATASYRLLPEILINQPVEDEEADFLVKRCPMNVFDIEELDKNGNVTATIGRDHIDKKKHRRAVVARPRNCTMCRECIRGDPSWNERIKLRRVRDHYIFSVETVGSYEPLAVVKKAIHVLKEKCQRVKRELNRKGEIATEEELGEDVEMSVAED